MGQAIDLQNDIKTSPRAWSKIFSKDDKLIELFQLAASEYKKSSDFEQAATALRQASLLLRKQKNFLDQAESLIEAGNCLSLSQNISGAIIFYTAGLGILVEHEKFGRASKLYERIADDFLSQNPTYLEEAIEFYKKAIQYYKLSDSCNIYILMQCKTKIARIFEALGETTQAIQIFLSLADEALSMSEPSLYRSYANIFLFNAGILYLSIEDTDNSLECARKMLKELESKYLVLTKLISLKQSQNKMGFHRFLTKNRPFLDSWQIQVLFKI
jgi:tetratricopeptide (TPR) repeat protein